MSHNNLDIVILRAHKWGSLAHKGAMGDRWLIRCWNLTVKLVSFLLKKQKFRWQTLKFFVQNVPYFKFLESSSLSLYFFLYSIGIVMFNNIFLFQWILNYWIISTRKIGRDRLYCEPRVFKRNVWVYNILAEERTDSGSSHLFKGSNHWAYGWKSRNNII